MMLISGVLRSIRPKLKTLSSKISGVKQKFNEKFFLKRRSVIKILAGFTIVTVGIMVISTKRVNALDDSLLTIIVSEMRRQNELRYEYNKKIFFKQRMGGYASMVSSAIQPLVPKRYKFMNRLNYLINVGLNLYMLFIDFYRK